MRRRPGIGGLQNAAAARVGLFVCFFEKKKKHSFV
jgi:hypothetical protein